MNHEAKFSSGIFGRRRTPSVASTSSSRLSIQSRSGSSSCPTSPRRTPKQLPPTPSTTNLNTIFAPTSSNICGTFGESRLHRSSSTTSTYSNGGGGVYSRQRSGYLSYTGNKIFTLNLKFSPSNFPLQDHHLHQLPLTAHALIYQILVDLQLDQQYI